MKRTLVAVFLLVALSFVGLQVAYGSVNYQVTDPPICYPDDNDCEPTPTPIPGTPVPGCPATEPGCPTPAETPPPKEDPVCPPDENECLPPTPCYGTEPGCLPPPDCPATEPGCEPTPEPPCPPDDNECVTSVSLTVQKGYRTVIASGRFTRVINSNRFSVFRR